MNLFELEEEKDITDSDIKYYKKEVERLETRVGVGATDYTKEMVDSSVRSTDEALIELTQMSIYLDDAIKKLDHINSLVNDKYNIYKKYNDYDKQIYTEKKLFKWSNSRISSRHNNIGKSSIYRIIEDIEGKKNNKK